jgi:hypothetical protein
VSLGDLEKGHPVIDDTKTEDVAGPDPAGEEPGVTRRQAVGAGAAGLTVLALGAQTAGAETNATASRLHRTVTINAPRSVVFDLEQVQRIQKDILGQLGCQACCSGWTIHFPDEVQYVLGKNNKLKQLSPAAVGKRLGVGT